MLNALMPSPLAHFAMKQLIDQSAHLAAGILITLLIGHFFGYRNAFIVVVVGACLRECYQKYHWTHDIPVETFYWSMIDVIFVALGAYICGKLFF